MEFGDKLRSLRIASGMSQQALADSAGVSRNSITNYETRKSIPQQMNLIVRLADALGTDMAALIDEKDYAAIEATERGGIRARKDLQYLTDQVTALFAGGEISGEDMEAALRAITEAYWIAKDANTKFVPKKYRKPRK